jgi:ubiquinone/menaquinone biosynthesis C-methylase UbiE
MMSCGFVYDRELSIKQALVARSPDMVAQRKRMHAALDLQPGERVLEVGCGNGIMAGEMAASVVPTGNVTGADISAAMVTMARAHCATLVNVEFIEADAADLPFSDGSFDVVTVTQCLCLVSDVEAAIGEIFRVLKSGGRAVILETDWDTLVWNCTEPRLMDKIMAIYKDAYTDARLPRTLSRLLKRAGFDIRGRDQFAMLNWTFDPDTCSGHQIDFTMALVENHQVLSSGELEAWLQSIRMAAEADEYFFSLNRYIFSAVKR